MSKVYGLIDPRYKRICYIGYTGGLLSARLRQHNNPTEYNVTPIANLARFLNKEGKKLSITQLAEFDSKEEALNSEMLFIKFFNEQGCNLKNVGEGGELNCILSTKERKQINNTWWKDNPKFSSDMFMDSEATLEDVYRLIKMFYTNCEIIKILDLNCGSSAIGNIRNGRNFKEEWEKHFKEPIPSLFKKGENGISGRLKYLIVRLIDKGYTIEHIGKRYPRIAADLKRIKNKTIWKKVWVLYEKDKMCDFY